MALRQINNVVCHLAIDLTIFKILTLIKGISHINRETKADPVNVLLNLSLFGKQ